MKLQLQIDSVHFGCFLKQHVIKSQINQRNDQCIKKVFCFKEMHFPNLCKTLICYVNYPPIKLFFKKAESVLVKRLTRVQCLHLAVRNGTAVSALWKHHTKAEIISQASLYKYIYYSFNSQKSARSGNYRRIIT